MRKACRSLTLLAGVAATLAAALAMGCGKESDDVSEAAKPTQPATVLTITDTSKPGDWSFDKRQLRAKAGKVTIVLRNSSGLGHNVRVHTGKCCFKPRYSDLGGTKVIGATSSSGQKTVRGTLNLEPGTYTFLCSIPGHYQTGQHGTLTVE